VSDNGRLFPGIDEGWLNLPHATSANTRTPDLNRYSLGKPYFDGVEPICPGQWVRIVFRAPRETSREGSFWSVGSIAARVDADRFRFIDLMFENGRASRNIQNARYQGVLVRSAEGWAVESLSDDATGSLEALGLVAGVRSTEPPPAVRWRRFRHADGREWAVGRAVDALWLRMVDADGEAFERTRPSTTPTSEVEALIQEQQLAGFVEISGG
jgi:hypothetical protein